MLFLFWLVSNIDNDIRVVLIVAELHDLDFCPLNYDRVSHIASTCTSSPDISIASDMASLKKVIGNPISRSNNLLSNAQSNLWIKE